MRDVSYGTELATRAVKHFKFESLDEFQITVFKGLVKLCLDELKKSKINTELTDKDTKDLVFTEAEQNTLQYKVTDIANYWSNDLECAFMESISERTDLKDRIGSNGKSESPVRNFYGLIYEFIEGAYGWKFPEF